LVVIPSKAGIQVFADVMVSTRNSKDLDPSRRKERLLGMTNQLHHSWRNEEQGIKNADPDETPVSLED
jgi:hypothetical protein